MNGTTAWSATSSDAGENRRLGRTASRRLSTVDSSTDSKARLPVVPSSASWEPASSDVYSVVRNLALGASSRISAAKVGSAARALTGTAVSRSCGNPGLSMTTTPISRSPANNPAPDIPPHGCGPGSVVGVAPST